MKDFIDKIKDILYDGTEYILMIAIIAAVALVINWRLDGLFAMDVENSDKQITLDNESIVDEYNEYVKNTEEETPEEEEEIEDNEKDAEIEKVVINITIPSGALPNQIANILVSKGLVESKSEFIDKVVEMGVEKKLKSGTFKIAKGSSLEEIVNIISK